LVDLDENMEVAIYNPDAPRPYNVPDIEKELEQDLEVDAKASHAS